uniref:Protease VP4 n=1 Tax=Blotched snakehead virus TaxID=311176 RepID=UPI0000D6F7E2
MADLPISLLQTLAYKQPLGRNSRIVHFTDGALFPVVAFGDNHSTSELYIAVRGDHRDLMSPDVRDSYALTGDDHKVWGATHHTYYVEGAPKKPLKFNVKTRTDLTILPVADVFWRADGSADVDVVWNDMPAVAGQSSSIALALASSLPFVPKAAYTGCLSGTNVQPVQFGNLKARAAHKIGLPLVGMTQDGGEDTRICTLDDAADHAFDSMESTVTR